MKKLFLAVVITGLVAALAAPVSAAEIKSTVNLRTRHIFTNSTGIVANVADNGDNVHLTTMRGNLGFTFVANEFVKVHWMTEMDMEYGDQAYIDDGRGDGGGLSTDTTNLETVSLYFDAMIPETPVTLRVGAQRWFSYGGYLSIMDAPGIRAMINLEQTNIDVGYFVLWDDNFDGVVDDVSLWQFDLDHKLANGAKVGGMFWYLKDGSGQDGKGAGFMTDVRGAGKGNLVNLQRNAGFGSAADRAALLPAGTRYTMNSFYLGLNGSVNLGPVMLKGYGVYNFGTAEVDTPGISDKDISSFLLDATAAMDVPVEAISKVELHGLYVSGHDDDSDFGLVTLSNYQLAGAFAYGPGMMILFPDGDQTNSNQGTLVYDVNNIWENAWLGVMYFGASGYFKLPMDLSATVRLGTLWSAEDRPVNSENQMGTELNAKLVYPLVKACTIELNGAYAWLGSFYDVSTSEAAAYNADASTRGTVNVNATDDAEDGLYWASLVLRARF